MIGRNLHINVNWGAVESEEGADDVSWAPEEKCPGAPSPGSFFSTSGGRSRAWCGGRTAPMPPKAWTLIDLTLKLVESWGCGE